MSSRILRPLGFAVAVGLLLLAVPAASQAAFSGTDFDGDGVPNADDNCLVVANPGQRPGASGNDGAACSGARERSTIHKLRYAYTSRQLDRIYRALDAGPMPGWDVESRGWVRCNYPGCQDRRGNTMLGDPFVPLLWKGQWFFTHKDGGYLWNRTLNDSRRDFRGTVQYGGSELDPRRAIVVTYPSRYNPFPVDHIVLESRAVQTGIYFCYAWEHIAVGDRMLLLFRVFQDTNNPN